MYFVRSFTVTLAIVIAFIEPQASGFTVRRNHNTTSVEQTETTDLASSNSFQQQVKNDLGKSNYIKSEKDEDSYKIAKGPNVVERDKNDTEKIKTKIIPIMTPIREITTENVKIPTISSDTVEVFDSVEDIRENKNVQGIKSKETSTRHSAQSDSIQTVMPIEKEVIITTTESSSEKIFSTFMSTGNDHITTEPETTQTFPAQKELGSSTLDTEVTSKIHTEMEDMSTSATATNARKVQGILQTGSTTNDLPTTSDTLFPSSLSSEEQTPISPEVISTYSSFDISDSTTDTINDKTTEPSWKKYTTIVRKRIISSEDTSQTGTTDNDAMKAETSNSHLNFANTFNVTPVPSLENLRILSNTNVVSTNNDIVSEEIPNTTMVVEFTIPSSNTVEYDEAKRTGTVQTKRAGFLDFSEKASTPLNIAEITAEPAMDEIEAPETQKQEFQNVSSSESRSQLAEDAIQEELLKEEALNNHVDMNRYKTDQSENIEVKELANDTAGDNVTLPSGSADLLSVQPINHERTKTTLYTVNPNYKPMKKIDVQPSKAFVRDPDDNSWRNESISSLGIVFKPKNSSISFKEVLKNKTQIELNNLTEKDNRGDVPDLRVRLEKIAEVRKTKKKKTNKDGEEVYSDYEGSAEISKPKPGVISTELSSTEPGFTTSPLPNPGSEPELTTPMNTGKDFVENKAKTMKMQTLFERLGIDPLTTSKPRKFFNIAEYYDTTDEYDADYVTMSRLDLKKFTVPARTTDMPITTLMDPSPTKPMKPYFPDRKPTVQYFPPRKVTPQKVNVNNVDADFERKVNLFTFMDPKMEFERPVVTEPPVLVATDRPEMRPTVKPRDFVMYTPPQSAKTIYFTNPPRTTEPHATFVLNNEDFNRGSYVIKHYKDFLNEAVKDNDDETNPDFVPFTEPPARGATIGEIEKTTKDKSEDYDYDLHFRKEVLSRFIDNFNQNSERFKVDFPVLYNSSVVHRAPDENGRIVASSRAFLKRVYNDEEMATKPSPLAKRPCEPHCEMTVELSPAYELHYYVPEQEEKEEASPRYRL